MGRFVLILYLFVPGFVMAEFNPFASELINISINGANEPNYLPAPGYWLDYDSFNHPERALGAPVGGGTAFQNNKSVVSLGGFGGQIVLAFDHDVEDNPANPLGLDAIVYSNAFWYGGQLHKNYHWSEPATIEIMQELNGNNIPGDDPGEIWYLIPGSNLSDASTCKTRHWTSEDDYYPSFEGWPDDYNTAAFELFPNYKNVNGNLLLVNPYIEDSDPCNDHLEGFWGYAEYTPTLLLGDRNADDFNDGFGDCPNMPAELFYTVPDNPFLVGIDAGSGGGDAFDIAWAVDPFTWQEANLPCFRYIRLTTAVDGEDGFYGELSSEIDAVADVRPWGDINGDDEVDYIDLDLFIQAWLSEWPQAKFNPAADFVVDNRIDFFDFAKFATGFGP